MRSADAGPQRSGRPHPPQGAERRPCRAAGASEVKKPRANSCAPPRGGDGRRNGVVHDGEIQVLRTSTISGARRLAWLAAVGDLTCSGCQPADYMPPAPAARVHPAQAVGLKGLRARGGAARRASAQDTRWRVAAPQVPVVCRAASQRSRAALQLCTTRGPRAARPGTSLERRELAP
jgi:hypothetical protein